MANGDAAVTAKAGVVGGRGEPGHYAEARLKRREDKGEVRGR